jgi:hypothetical protein
MKGVTLRRDWAVAGAGIALAAAAFSWRGGSVTPGARLPFIVTVVPGDADSLDCAADAAVGGHRCGWDDRDLRAEVQHPLRPFVSSSGELLLLGNLFEETNVAAWLRDARITGSTARVTLDCRGTYLGTFSHVRVRFGAAGAWEPHRDVTAGRIETCTISAPVPAP